jgi:hypothetical protein
MFETLEAFEDVSFVLMCSFTSKIETPGMNFELLKRRSLRFLQHTGKYLIYILTKAVAGSTCSHVTDVVFLCKFVVAYAARPRRRFL